jgi:dethiobiotin synthetase
MIPQFIVTGTDTNVGKTMLASLLMASLPEYHYWKPIQSGLDTDIDSEIVQRQSGCEPDRIFREAYRLTEPLSPHLSSKIDGVVIQPDRLALPTNNNLIIEGAGGVLVPINQKILMIDLFAEWKLPVVIATRSSLGTINHTLLTIEALRKRTITILGCVTIGDLNRENEEAISQFGNTTIVGRIPHLQTINASSLRLIFEQEFGNLRKLLEGSK